jgi:histidinol-phosphate aminotransferase
MPEANSYIASLAPYQPGMPVETLVRKYGLEAGSIVKLASNENPLGPSPLALSAMKLAGRNVHQYPDQYDLIQALAQHLGVDEASIVVGNGSNDILDLIARTYLDSGDEAIVSQYAFAMYRLAAQSVGASNIVVPAKDYGHDLDAMLAAVTEKTKVIWIANPNNPTGTFMPYEDLEDFIRKVPGHIAVVLDEAYYEYLDPADRVLTQEWVTAYPNVLIVRTFSKIYGLAGLRVGYAIAAPEVSELLNRVRLPFTSNGLAVVAAVAALEDQEFAFRSFALNRQERLRMQAALREKGVEQLPAWGNFITIRVTDGAAAYESLLKKGIIVRPLASYDMPNWLRVTIGLPKENDRFLQTL